MRTHESWSGQVGPTLIAAVAMTTFGLAACGGEARPPQPPPSLPAPTASVTAPVPTAAPPPPPAKPRLSELIPQTLKGIDDAFNAHDAQKMASYYADDAAVYTYGGGETHSKGDLENSIAQLFAAFDDAKSAPDRVFVKNNVAVVELTWTGTMTADFMAMKATKKQAGEMRLHVMWFDDDGLVKEVHQYGDSAGVMSQVAGKRGAPPVPMLRTNPPEVHAAQGTPDGTSAGPLQRSRHLDEDKLADWGKAIDDAFNRDDPKAVAAGMADDADYWLNFTGQPAMKGKKELLAGLGGWFKAFPDQKWTVTNAWGIDGYAIVEHAMSGTQKGPLGPIPASNKSVTAWHWVDIMQPAADGKVQHGWGYANLYEMMAQTGTLKKPAENAAAPPKK
jgi:steroid delta-isomerase-like uncharacterized protein